MRSLHLLCALAACSGPTTGPAPVPAPAPEPMPAPAPVPDPAPEPGGSIDLATFCHGVSDKATAPWMRLDDTALEAPDPGCYLPWADQPSQAFQPHSDATGWVDLDLARIAETECIEGTPSPIQRAAMLMPEILWVRVPSGTDGRTLKLRVRPLGDAGWDPWLDVHSAVIDRRVFSIPLQLVVRDERRSTLELEVTVADTAITETVIIHWPTRC